MSPSYRTPEQYQRWHVCTCARCGRRAGKAANWPDGPICRTCHDRAARTRGRCPGCQVERLLPGRRPEGTPICPPGLCRHHPQLLLRPLRIRGVAVRRPAELRQHDVDAWHATHREHHKRALRAFLTWAMDTGRLPRLALLPLQVRRAQPITQRRRLDLLRRLLTDQHAPLRPRVAAYLMLLYAQPASRIVRLTVEDIVQDGDGQVLIRLGDPPTPVPEPFASLLLQAAASRGNMNTAANPAARWLFPGRRAGQPLNPSTLGALIRDLGPTVTARTAAMRQLVQAPPHRSLPKRLASTGSPRTGPSSRSAAPGAATPPATT